MKVLHVTGENAATGRKGENGSYGDMTPPRSLGRYAPAVRLRRADGTHRRVIAITRKRRACGKSHGVAVFP